MPRADADAANQNREVETGGQCERSPTGKTEWRTRDEANARERDTRKVLGVRTLRFDHVVDTP